MSPATHPPAAGERELLLGSLAQARYLLTLTAHGLTDEPAHATPTVSSLSVGGLIAHSAAVERLWMNRLRQRATDGSGADDPASAFTRGDRQPLADSLREYRAAAENTDAVVAGAPLVHSVPFPGNPLLFGPARAWSLRWVLALLIVETARHTGHADLIRESIDGATAFPLLAAAEKWPVDGPAPPWRR